jgi:hypothetical protein
MELTIQVNQVERTVRFREVHALAAGDSCAVTLDGIRGADVPSLRMALYRDAASESPVASCPSFAPVQGHPNLASGTLRLDTVEMAAWFEAVRPETPQAGSSSRDRPRPEDAAERAVRTDGWLVVSDSARTWAACRVPVILRPGAGTSGVVDPTSLASLVEGLVSAAMSGALAGKADKASPAAPGNLASLDASGNLSDSGATPASIKAAAVAEVVANAPGTMDTLKEIADILGSAQQAGTVLKRISDLESGKAEKSEMSVTPGTGADADKTTVQLKNGTSATVLVAHQDVSGKRDLADMYVRGAPQGAGSWFVIDGETYTWSPEDSYWVGREGTLGLGDDTYYYIFYGLGHEGEFTLDDTFSAIDNGHVFHGYVDVFAKESQIPMASTATPQMDSGNGAAGASAQFARGDHVHPSDTSKANMSDLPYALVTPGEWTFSGTGYLPQFDWRVVFYQNPQDYTATLEMYSPEDTTWLQVSEVRVSDNTVLSIDFGTVTATRASLPGHLCDRAGNRVVVSGDTTLTLPAAVPSYLRDFLVRLEISGSTVPTITFAAPTGETIAYETDGDEFPVPDAEGTWLYSFTETAAGVFAVALKKVSVVTQGGS